MATDPTSEQAAADETSAVRVVVRFYADRGVICTDSEARWIVRTKKTTESISARLGSGAELG